jgi:hypothetical protein
LQIFIRARLSAMGETLSPVQKEILLSSALNNDPLNLDMITVILSVGPVIVLSTHLQHLLAARLEGLGHHAAVDTVATIAKHARFRRSTTPGEAFASEKLWKIFVAEPVQLQMELILEPDPDKNKLSHRSLLRRWWQRRVGEN